MRKMRLILCFVIILSTALCSSACSLYELGSDNVHFRYFWWEDDNAYYIKATSVEGRMLKDVYKRQL